MNFQGIVYLIIDEKELSNIKNLAKLLRVLSLCPATAHIYR